jgi:hypothetical protein
VTFDKRPFSCTEMLQKSGRINRFVIKSTVQKKKRLNFDIDFLLFTKYCQVSMLYKLGVWQIFSDLVFAKRQTLRQ